MVGGGVGGEIRRRGGGLYTYIPVATTITTRTTPCIKMGRDESRIHISLIVRDKVTKQCPQTTTFEDIGEQKRIRTEVPSAY